MAVLRRCSAAALAASSCLRSRSRLTISIICYTPSASISAAALEATAVDCSVHGAARHLPNGSLELTPSSAYDAEGTAVCAAPQGVRYGGAAHLVLSFELELGRDGDGASVSYGKLPEDGGLGAGGASLVLSLRFLSRLRPPRCSMTTKSSTLSRCRPRRAAQASRWRRRQPR